MKLRKEIASKRRPRRRILSITASIFAVLAAVGLVAGYLSLASNDGGITTAMDEKNTVGSNDDGGVVTAIDEKNTVVSNDDGGVITAMDKKGADPKDDSAKPGKRKKRIRKFARWEDKVVKPPIYGKVCLITAPWTDVYYRGRKIGQTPLVDVKLPAGNVKLRVVNVNAGIDRKITVRIKPGKTTKNRFDLSRKSPTR